MHQKIIIVTATGEAMQEVIDQQASEGYMMFLVSPIDNDKVIMSFTKLPTNPSSN